MMPRLLALSALAVAALAQRQLCGIDAAIDTEMRAEGTCVSLLQAKMFLDRQASSPRLPLLPFPTHVRIDHGAPAFRLRRGIDLELAGEVTEGVPAVRAMREALGIDGDKALDSEEPVRGRVKLELISDKAAAEESYTLNVRENDISLVAPAAAGLFYGTQTLLQLLQGDAREIPQLSIQDSPRFKWRGLMMDVSRHFFDVKEVKGMLETMAAFKLNRFHWHLTDDQGWRLPVDGYPNLTQIGAKSAPGSPPRFYTKDQIREVVAYAKDRHIEVVPEVDVPGHVASAIASYPELGNEDSRDFKTLSAPLTEYGAFMYTLAPSNATMRFLDELTKTLVELFTAPWIHVGGDEVQEQQWETSPSAQKVMQMQGEVVSGASVQRFFNREVGKRLASIGKIGVNWDEAISIGGVPQASLVMAWRGPNEAVKALAQNKQVIVSDQNKYYFDWRQVDKLEELGRSTVTTLASVYESDPMPPGTAPERQALVLGAQCQLWSENLKTIQQVQYMAFPRALAMAERLWTPVEQVESFAEFKTRLHVRLKDLDARGVSYRPLDGEAASGSGRRAAR